VGGLDADGAGLITILTNLVGKSLVSADVSGASVNYRLLDTTRAYAHDKLVESGEFDQVSRRHAEYFHSLFARGEAELTTLAAAEWIAVYGRQLDNARSALDWAFSPRGDAVLGVALTIAVTPVWLHLLLNEECRARVETALACLAATGQEGHQAMQLLAALGNTLLYTKGAATEASKAWAKTLEIAEKTHDSDYQLLALRGLWADALNGGEIQSALTFAERFGAVAQTSDKATDTLIADRLIAQVLYFRGDIEAARSRYDHILSRYPANVTRLDTIRFQFDQRLIAHADFSRILWIQGYPDQAMRTIETTIEEARDIDNAISMNYALAHAACPIALYTGNLLAAERYADLLLQRAQRSPVRPWDLWARCWTAVLLGWRGDAASGAQMLASALDMIPANAFHMRYTSFLRQLAEAWARAGEVRKASAVIDRAIEMSAGHDEHWADAELLRVKGELILLADAGNAAAAEDYFRQAIDRARLQRSLSWELRATTSLANLSKARQQFSEVKSALRSVYGRFTEGFETVDLIKARTLLDSVV
jgi:predicted ATPase